MTIRLLDPPLHEFIPKEKEEIEELARQLSLIHILNALVGEKVAIVSDKPQTTRNRIMGVVNRPEFQMVLLDTPGVHTPRTKLGQFMDCLLYTSRWCGIPWSAAPSRGARWR